MSVPFRDLRDEDSLGLAAYLRFVEEEGGRGIRGALFLVDSRGEPVEFVFSRIDVPASFLWRGGEAKRHAVAKLSAALFQGCSKSPTLLMTLAEEVHPMLFAEDILLGVPACRVANSEEMPRTLEEAVETLSNAVHLFWIAQPASAECLARQLLEALHARQLVTEPFERAARGIEEAFART